MSKSIILIISSVLFLSACAQTTKDITTHTHKHKSYNYKDKTFQFLKVKTQVNDPDNKLQASGFEFESYIKKTIYEELKKLGLKQSSSQADITVSYGIDVNMAARKFNLFGNAEEGFLTNKPKSALTIIITNKKSHEVLWEAWTNAQYKQRETEVAKKRIEYAISELFKEFPK